MGDLTGKTKEKAGQLTCLVPPVIRHPNPRQESTP